MNDTKITIDDIITALTETRKVAEGQEAYISALRSRMIEADHIVKDLYDSLKEPTGIVDMPSSMIELIMDYGSKHYC